MGWILEYLYCFIYCLSLTYAVSQLTLKKISNKRILLSLPIYALINYAVTGSSSDSPGQFMIVNSLVIVINIIYTCWLLRNTKINNLFYSTVYTLLYSVSVNSIIHVINLFINFDHQSTLVVSLERTLMVITINIVTIVIVILMKKYKLLPNNIILAVKPSLFIPLNIIVYYAMMIIYSIRDEKNINLITLLVLILIILWSVFLKIISLYVETTIKNEELIIGEISDKYLSNYMELIKRESDNYHKIKHDLKNHKEILEAVDKLNNYSQYIDDIFADSESNHVQTGNIFVDSCLYAKQEEYPDIDFDFDISIKGLNINEKDIVSLLFNLIDNACQEALKSDKKVKVDMKYDNTRLVIKVINSCLSKPNFKSTNGQNHGYGLKIIRGIVAKYNGEIFADYVNQRVIFDINFLI